MRKIQEILRLKEAGLSSIQIARSVNTSPSTVSVLLSQAEKAGLSWPLPEGMDETTHKAMLYPGTEDKAESRPLPDMELVHRGIKRKHVTLQLLWEEHIASHPNGYRYSYFCELVINSSSLCFSSLVYCMNIAFSLWLRTNVPVIHLTKLFVPYCQVISQGKSPLEL